MSREIFVVVFMFKTGLIHLSYPVNLSNFNLYEDTLSKDGTL
jgi:hypothetical protein